MRLLLHAIVVAGGLATSPAPAGEPFAGRWVADPAACASEKATLVVTSLWLSWREAFCAVKTSYRVREAWHIGARCWGEGATSDVPIKLQMRGERLVLGWAGARPEELRRCP